MHEVTRDTASLRAAGRFIYRQLTSCCDHVIVHTQTAHRVLTGRLGVAPAMVTVVPHPAAQPPSGTMTAADLRARYQLGTATVLLAFGFIHVDKGLDDLVRALAILPGPAGVPGDGFRLIVAGGVRPRQGLFRCFELRDRLHLRRVTRVMRRSRLQRQVVFTGYVPDGEVAAWFQAAAAVVLPYRRTDQSGVAGLAHAFGVPVLASTAGGLHEQLADNRWTFPPRNPESLSRVLAGFPRPAAGRAPYVCPVGGRRHRNGGRGHLRRVPHRDPDQRREHGSCQLS